MNLLLRRVLVNNYLYISLLLFDLILILVFINQSSFNTINEITNVEGKIIEYKIDGNHLGLVIKNKEKYKVNYYFKSQKELIFFKNKIKYGISIKVKGIRTIPLNNTIPNTFNYKNYLKSKKIFYIINAQEIVISNKINYLYEIKNYLVKKIYHFQRADYLSTFILGDKSLLNEETYEEYQSNGISHLFAISGMHINLLSLIIIFILKKIKVKESKRFIIVSIILIFYVFITNFSPSIMRSALFFSILALNKIFYTQLTNIQVFIITISLIIIFNPLIVYNIGFLYSFLTSLGLILNSKYISDSNYFISLIKVSVVALLYSLPITLQNFFEINILSLLNNLIFVPLISLIVYPLSLITLLIPFFDSLFSLLIMIMETISKFLASIKINIIIPKNNFIILLIYYLLLYYAFNKNNKFIFLCIFLIILPKILINFNYNYEIYYLDVGQGDAILIRAPNNKENFMIDVGGKINFSQEDWQMKKRKYHISDNIIIFLKSLGISKLDSIITTHGDEDHLGEAVNLINNFKVQNVMFNKGDYNQQELNIINTKVNIIDSYQSVFMNIRYLETNRTNNENDNSTIILISMKNKLFLFMGDASKKQELEIINKYSFPEIEVLKIGHHGSKTSSDPIFIKNINPKYAIISSGRNNRFNHPSIDVLNILNLNNVKHYNTQEMGTIKLSIARKVNFSFTKP